MTLTPRHASVVEDEPGLRLTLTDRLTSEGYSVETASDGDAGPRPAPPAAPSI